MNHDRDDKSIHFQQQYTMIFLNPQEVSIFLFEKRSAEKLHKPKRKETVTEILRGGVRQLERFRHPKILQVIIVNFIQPLYYFGIL